MCPAQLQHPFGCFSPGIYQLMLNQYNIFNISWMQWWHTRVQTHPCSQSQCSYVPRSLSEHFNGCNVCQCINPVLGSQGFLWPTPAASNSKHSEQKPSAWHKKFARFHAIQDNMCTIRQKFSELFALAWQLTWTVNWHLETFSFSLNKLTPMSQFLLIIFRNAIDN